MNKLHKMLLGKSEAYNQWHENPNYKARHWVIFMAVSLLLTASLINVINLTYIDEAKAAGSTQQISPNRVLIIYNANWTGDENQDGVQDSLEVANYYAMRRGVPSTNLLGLAFSNYATFESYTKFQSELIQPLKTKLSALGPTNIDVILLSYYTPWKYNAKSVDSLIMGLNLWNATSDNTGGRYSNPYFEPNPTFGSDKGNFNHTYKVNSTDMYLVSRLDGPGKVSRMLSFVDEGLYADKYASTQQGYFHGNGYVDSQGRLGDYTDAFLAANSSVQSGNYGSYEGADVNIAYSEHHILAAGIPLKWHKGGDTIGSGTYHDGSSASTAPDAMLYGGWYNLNNYKDVFSWLPGSVAADLNSTGFAYEIHQEDTIDWAAQSIRHGVSGVAGVVDEPYVDGTTRPHTLIYYILNGYSFAEAMGAADPYISWKAMHVGDPLMAPFAQKTPVLDTTIPRFLSQYPKPFFSEREGNLIEVRVDESGDPDVVKATITYGPTQAYGETATTQYYASYHRVSLPNLVGGVTYHYQVTITDPAGNSTTTGDLTFTPPAQLPYGGTAWSIPGTIKFKDFDTGGEGVAYHDSNTSNYAYNQARVETGVEVTYWDPYPVWGTKLGEWLEYTVNVTQTDTYDIGFVICNACVWGGKGTFHLEVDNVNVTGPIAMPTTTGSWQTVTKSGVALSAGTHVLRVFMDTIANEATGEFDKMIFTATGNTDTIAPTVTLTAPSAGATVSETITLAADASDNVGVTSVQFKVDGNNLGSPDTIFPYETFWDSTLVPNGSHVITAVASDAAGNSTVSNSVTVTVSNQSASAHMVLNPLSFTFTGVSGGQTPASQNLNLQNSGSQTLNWSANPNQSWCHINSTTGSLNPATSVTLLVSVDSPSNVGSFNCQIVITDPAADNSPQTVNITYTVTSPVDTTPPIVNISYPGNGMIVPRLKTLEITAIADDDSGISRVEFYINGNLKCTDTTQTYSCNYKVPGAKGKVYRIQAIAYDIYGNMGVSTIVSVTAQ